MLIILLILLLSFQQIQTQPQQDLVQHHWEVMPKDNVRLTKYILFLFDSSGSMNEKRIKTAIEFVLNNRTGVAAAPFDDFYIALATFGSKVARWEGAPDLDPKTNKPISKYGWAAMPSETNLKAARAWISSNLDGGATYFIPGIKHCFSSNSGEKQELAGLKNPVLVDNLTILIITDGDFAETDEVDKTIKNLQKQRKDKKLAEAILGFVGIEVRVPENPKEKPSGGHANLLDLAKKHAILGYMRIEVKSLLKAKD